MSQNLNMQPPVICKSFVTVNKSRAEVYSFLRDLNNLPRFIKHLKSFSMTGERTYEFNTTIAGYSEPIALRFGMIADEPQGKLELKSLSDSYIDALITIHLKDGDKFGTEVYAQFFYQPQDGVTSKAVNLLLSSLAGSEWLKEDLKDLRRLIETGEIPTIKGQPSGNNKK